MEQENTKSIVRKLSVKRRITLMVILISVFPILVISIFSYAKAYISVRQTAFTFARQTLLSVKDTLLRASDPSEILNDDDEQYLWEALRTDPARALRQNACAYLEGISVSLSDGTTLSGSGEAPDTGFSTAGWRLTENRAGEQRLALLLELTDSNGQDCRVNILFRPELLGGRLNIYDACSRNHLVLVDDAGKLVLDNDTPLTILEKEAIRQQEFAATVEPLCSEEDHGSFLCYLSVPALQATLVFIAPYTEMMKPLQSIFFGTLFGTIVLLNIAMVVIDSIDRPMKAMVRSFGDAAKNNFEVVQSDESRDELGILNQAFNEICREMREALNKVEKEQTEKRRAEIRMLQAQINPHFLFNTLDSLRFTSMMNNVPVVSDGLAALSHLLRSSILKENAFTPLQSELQTIEDYLTLQRIRSCETIVLKTDIDEQASSAAVMRLLLQPVVENAVIHGIKENIPLTIQLSAKVRQGMMHISIKDDGKGFDSGKAGTDGVPKSSKMSGIGLHNVKDRLYLAYKDNQSFAIQSTPGVGTEVSIVMPYSVWKEEPDVQGDFGR